MMSLDRAFTALIRRLEQIESVAQRLSTRVNSIVREGVVKSVDPAKGVAVVEAHGIDTKPIPWMQQAGAINEWTPLSVGQRVSVISPGGDLGRAFILPGGYTEQTPQPHDQGAQKRVKIGDCVLTQSAEGVVLQVGGTTFEFTAGGFKQTGGKMLHDDKNVGSTHKHTDVVAGSDKSGIPLPPD